jgi:Fe-S-cluster containining protein
MGNCGRATAGKNLSAQSLIADEVAASALDSSARSEPFGYSCHRCLRCCHHKHIQVNPYEIAHIARNRDISTTECRIRWTVEGQGAVLAQTESGACVFLGPEGCMIHANRPLVCRLYPLGRHVASDGSERFSHLEPHPQSAGEYTLSGTIGEYLASQGAAPFMRAADDYYFWINRVKDLVSDASPSSASPINRDGSDALQYLDLDAAIADYCATHDLAEPDDMEERRLLHITILEDLLNLYSTGASK